MNRKKSPAGQTWSIAIITAALAAAVVPTLIETAFAASPLIA
jgi:hypothetical protein